MDKHFSDYKTLPCLDRNYESLTAVSYTHLDVYKRQVWVSARARLCVSLYM